MKNDDRDRIKFMRLALERIKSQLTHPPLSEQDQESLDDYVRLILRQVDCSYRKVPHAAVTMHEEPHGAYEDPHGQ